MLLVFFATGFWREFVFLNVNEQMRVAYYDSPDTHLAPSMEWLTSFSYEQLYWLKWPLTMGFTALFGVYSITIVRLIFHERSYQTLTLWAYIVVFAGSFLFFGIGWFLNSYEFAYTIARFLAGLIETPAMLAILVAAFMVHRRK